MDQTHAHDDSRGDVRDDGDDNCEVEGDHRLTMATTTMASSPVIGPYSNLFSSLEGWTIFYF